MQPKFKVRKGDQVIVTAGKDSGRKGEVIKVLLKDARLLVRGINVLKRHTKPSAENPEGGIVQKEASIHISNVQLVDPESGLATRVGYKILKDGKKVRFAKRSGQVIDKN
ncbi:MAG: 50S ribosomal protein L24 [Alphaproteobacteria bacterium]|nr:50S ribosomal protein L24 [Alphaproteobacteria bacterium]